MERTLYGWMKRNDRDRCDRCGRILTPQEKRYYVLHCERCGGKIMKILQEKG